MRRVRTSLAVAAVAALWTSPCAAGARLAEQALERLRQRAVVELDVMVPMRDGVKLATDIVRPKGEGKHPAVLARTPYRKSPAGGDRFVREGYAYVAQDCRGRFASEGEHRPFLDDPNDAFDTLAWLAEQPWCDGKVGMTGGSYLGYTQLAAAMTQPPTLRCIMPTVPPSDFDHRTVFFDGALRLELAQGWLLGQARTSQRVVHGQVPAAELARWRPQADFRKWCWHLPLRDPGPIAIGGPGYAGMWQDAMTSWEKPGQWKAYSGAERPEDIRVPVLVTAGFFDIFAQENLDLVLALRQRGGSEAARQHSHLVIGPWVHGIGRPAGDARFPKANAALAGRSARWLARWLKGEANEVDRWPPIYAFVMGKDRWLATDTWPPPQSKPTKLYLSKGKLAFEPPAPQEPSSFIYDPASPVPTLGGCNLILPKGVHDHRKNAGRPDVLAFVSEPLERDLVVVGRLRAHLFVSTSAPDTDFTAMLLDIRPDGYQGNVQDGIVRLRYREGRGAPKLVKPGEVVEADIDLWSTAYTFKAGHGVALHVSSSNFPRFDRSLNAAEAPPDWTTGPRADNKVYHEPDRASYVELPLFPSD